MVRLLCFLMVFFPAMAFAADPLDVKMSAQYHAVGYAHQKRGDFLQARLFYERAEAFLPDDARLQNDLGLVFEALGRVDEAEKHYMKAITVDYKCLPAYSNLGYFYKARGDMERAARYFEQRVAFGDPRDPWTLQAQSELDGIIHSSPELMKKRIKLDQKTMENSMALRAQEEIRTERREKVVNVEMDYWRGFMLFDMHQYRQARVLFEQCLKQDPGYHPAQEMLDRVDTFLVMDSAGNNANLSRSSLVTEYADMFQTKSQRDERSEISALEAYVHRNAEVRDPLVHQALGEAEKTRVIGK